MPKRISASTSHPRIEIQKLIIPFLLSLPSNNSFPFLLRIFSNILASCPAAPIIASVRSGPSGHQFERLGLGSLPQVYFTIEARTLEEFWPSKWTELSDELSAIDLQNQMRRIRQSLYTPRVAGNWHKVLHWTRRNVFALRSKKHISILKELFSCWAKYSLVYTAALEWQRGIATDARGIATPINTKLASKLANKVVQQWNRVAGISSREGRFEWWVDISFLVQALRHSPLASAFCWWTTSTCAAILFSIDSTNSLTPAAICWACASGVSSYPHTIS